MPQAELALLEQRQRQQHEQHHLQTADQLVNAALYLLIDLLLLQTIEQRAGMFGEPFLPLAGQAGRFDGRNPGWFPG